MKSKSRLMRMISGVNNSSNQHALFVLSSYITEATTES